MSEVLANAKTILSKADQMAVHFDDPHPLDSALAEHVPLLVAEVERLTAERRGLGDMLNVVMSAYSSDLYDHGVPYRLNRALMALSEFLAKKGA